MIRNYLTSLNICFCGEDHCESGHGFGPAMRPYYLLHVILCGKGIFSREDRRWHLSAGDAFLIRPGEVTYYEADAESPWHYVWIAFQGSDAEALIEQDSCFSGTAVWQIPEEDRERFFAEALELKKRFLRNGHHSLELMGGFLQLISMMLKSEQVYHETQQTEYIFMAKEFIIQNCNNTVRIQDVADYVGLNRSYLYKLFMEYEGCSPKQYLINYQLDMAKGMLSEGGCSITEIAHRCGFYDASAFCRQFKKHYRLSPSEYLLRLE